MTKLFRWALWGISVLTGLSGAGVCRGEGPAAHEATAFGADHYARQTVYHSPQTPGYTCWVGAWIMADESLMVSFDQATGPLDGRPRTSETLLKKMGITLAPGRDFAGLRLANVFLRSTDGGASWTQAGESTFTGPFDRPVFGGSYCALTDGTILRAVDGSQLPLAPDLPRRIFFQRSRDFGATWGKPEIPPEPRRTVEDFLGDAGDCITRVRRLKGGRLAATGVSRPDPTSRRRGEPLLMLSSDEGRTWTPQRLALPAPASASGVWNEWDSAELPGGDLLCVFRRSDPRQPRKQVRWQGVLKKQGEGAWRLENYGPSPLEHSGHPELLSTREGVILHIASTGIHWTADAGATWKKLNLCDQSKPLRSCYYPRSVQAKDGRIFVFSHRGGDNAYGQYDQAIVMDVFHLAKIRDAAP